MLKIILEKRHKYIAFLKKETNMLLMNMKATNEFLLMLNILKQLKNRRKELGLKQEDFMLRVGMSRQQYQYLESKGNPRLNTLELVAKGLKCELLLIPQEKLTAVKILLTNEDPNNSNKKEKPAISDDPWQGILENDE